MLHPPTWHSLKSIIRKTQSLLVCHHLRLKGRIFYSYISVDNNQNSLNFLIYPVPRSCFSNAGFFTSVIYRGECKMPLKNIIWTFNTLCSILCPWNWDKHTIFPFGIDNITPLLFFIWKKAVFILLASSPWYSHLLSTWYSPLNSYVISTPRAVEPAV